MHVKVIVTTPDGEVLEKFVAAPFRGGEKTEIDLAANVRDKLENFFCVADEVTDLEAE